MNFDDLDLKQLKELRVQVDNAITTFADKKRRAALEAVRKVAEEHGFGLNQLLTNAKHTRSPAEAKYAKPGDPDVTWSGRGRKPGWVNEHLAAGHDLDDLKVR